MNRWKVKFLRKCRLNMCGAILINKKMFMSSLCSSALFHDCKNFLNNSLLKYRYINYNFFFIDINECMVFGTCSQHCHNLKGSYRCECEKNYKERNNSCIAKGKKYQNSQCCHLLYRLSIFLKQICHGKIILMSH